MTILSGSQAPIDDAGCGEIDGKACVVDSADLAGESSYQPYVRHVRVGDRCFAGDWLQRST